MRTQLQAALEAGAVQQQQVATMEAQLQQAAADYLQARHHVTAQQHEMAGLQLQVQQVLVANQFERQQHQQTFDNLQMVVEVMLQRTQEVQQHQQTSDSLQAVVGIMLQRTQEVQQQAVRLQQCRQEMQQLSDFAWGCMCEVERLKSTLQQQMDTHSEEVQRLSGVLQQQSSNHQEEVQRLTGHICILQNAVNDVLAGASGARVVGMGPVGDAVGVGVQGAVRTVQLTLVADSNPAQPGQSLVPVPGVPVVVSGVVKSGDARSPNELAFLVRAAQHAARVPGASQLLPRVLKVQLVGDQLQFIMEAFEGSVQGLVYGQVSVCLGWGQVRQTAGVHA
jgi:hypothetical protein